LYFKIHGTENNTVLACCDKELIGKAFEEGDFYFEVKETFYKGETIDEEKLIKLLEENSNINLVGNKTIGIAIKQGFLREEDIIKIKNIKHAIILKV